MTGHLHKEQFSISPTSSFEEKERVLQSHQQDLSIQDSNVVGANTQTETDYLAQDQQPQIEVENQEVSINALQEG